jgi:hypothetical protein
LRTSVDRLFHRSIAEKKNERSPYLFLRILLKYRLLEALVSWEARPRLGDNTLLKKGIQFILSILYNKQSEKYLYESAVIIQPKYSYTSFQTRSYLLLDSKTRALQRMDLSTVRIFALEEFPQRMTI